MGTIFGRQASIYFGAGGKILAWIIMKYSHQQMKKISLKRKKSLVP
jgi:hypothetical protein